MYGNGKNQPPTAIDLDKELLRDFLFNQSPSKVIICRKTNKIYFFQPNIFPDDQALYFDSQFFLQDIALASVSMRPIPFSLVTEKLSLSDNNYGSVQRFYIVTQEDRAISIPLQEAMIYSNPPQQVFRVKGSDHAPFFSRPQALHKILVDIFHTPNQV